MSVMIDYQADTLSAKIKHYLITTMGRTADEANDEEFYRAFSYSLREEIMINWLATAKSLNEIDATKLYYLSMEYLPGRFMSNNVTNLCAGELVRSVMKKMNKDLVKVNFYESDPALGNGGLGRLASCFLDSLATQHYPATAYGLRYQYGIFEQHILDGQQIEAPDCWLLNENPWEFRRDLRRRTVKFCGTRLPKINIHGDEVSELSDFEEVWALPYDLPIIGFNDDSNYSVLTLRLWSTKESPRNFQLQKYNAGRLDQAAENTTLTDVLYPTDFHETGKRIRLKQEFLLVSASLQDIIRHYKVRFSDFRSFGDLVRIQINDTHPSLVIPELLRLLTKEHSVPWTEALAITRRCTGYTNHTILSEALEQWDQGLMRYLLPRQYHIIERLNSEFCDEVRLLFPGDEEKVRRVSILENDKVKMAPLAIVGSHSVNGVAELHSKIIKERLFKDFADIFPEKFTNVTNGVTQRRWLLHCNPDLADFISKRIGQKWITDFSEIKKIADYADDDASQKEFLDIKNKNKMRLAEFLQKNETINFLPNFDTDAIFDVQIKRIHEYKRQLLNALHILMLYNEIVTNPQHSRAKRLFIFAGKAAASYETAKNIILLIHCIARLVNNDSRSKHYLQVVFIPNYNVSHAEMIIPAADLSEQISTAGLEASGTGNMKLTMNGALTIGTEDGANIEMKEEVTPAWWPFTFGARADEIANLQKNNSYKPWDIYNGNPSIKKAVDMLRDHSLTYTDTEHQALLQLYNSLVQGSADRPSDPYFILHDIEAYYSTQKQVDALFCNQKNWVQHAIHNIAGMWKFSADRSIHEYAQRIWGITPTRIDEKILEKIRQEYSEHDKCRIY